MTSPCTIAVCSASSSIRGRPRPDGAAGIVPFLIPLITAATYSVAVSGEDVGGGGGGYWGMCIAGSRFGGSGGWGVLGSRMAWLLLGRKEVRGTGDLYTGWLEEMKVGPF